MPFFIQKEMADSIQIFKRKLTNLSSSNPYLWIRRLKADVFLDLAEIGKVHGDSGWSILNEVFSGKKSITLCPLANHSQSDENWLSLKLGALLKKQKLTIQERGTNELHMAYPFVLGQWPDGTWVKTPLLLIPVSLVSGAKSWQLQPNLDGALINPAFLLAYSFHFKQDLDASLFEKSLEIDSGDGIEFLTFLYNKLKNSRLEIHFNQALFSSSIQEFGEIRREEMPVGFQPGMLKLQPEAVLGLFPQSDSILIPDFQYLESLGIPIDSIFLKEMIGLQPVSEKNLLCPLPVDGSQEACIREVKSGKSLVVQGPPGTGKSQLIANLMADAMGSGKSVLLVCQKKVALEVVRARLAECGLQNFVALWADFKNDKSLLFNHLVKMIEAVEESEKIDSNLNTVVLERNFIQVCQSIDSLTQKLENWQSNLLNSSDSGISVLELYQTSRKSAEGDFRFSDFSKMVLSDWTECREWLRQNWEAFFLTLQPDSKFSQRSNWSDFFNQKVEIPTLWARLWQNCMELKSEVAEFGISLPADFHLGINELALQSTHVGQELDFVQKSSCQIWTRKPLSFWFDPDRIRLFYQMVTDLKNLHREMENWPFDFAISDIELKEWIDRVRNRKSLSTNRMVVKVMAVFSQDANWFFQKLEAFQLSGRPLLRLEEKLRRALEWLNLSTKLGFSDEGKISLSSIRQVSFQMAAFEKESDRFESLIKNVKAIKEQWPDLDSWEELSIGLRKFQDWNLRYQSLNKSWLEYFPESGNLEFNLPEISGYIEHFRIQSDLIYKADLALKAANPIWASLVDEAVAYQKFQKIEKRQVLDHLDNAWRNTWIQFLESKHPVLTEVSTDIWEEDLDLLRESVKEKSELVRKILLLKLRESTYKNLDYNRLGNRTTFRELYHKASKKRMKPSLRQLWDEHSEELKRLLPAWLATPESVSATWPMETGFDLVIFDESSQCFAERGIPAAFRGKQIVVVGDDKQLPPHHLFSARWEEGEEDQFSGQDSLLDLAKQFLPQRVLTQHYRSVYPELIEFSNRYFYEGHLESIPDSTALQNRRPAIRFEKIEGQWKNQTNENEAIVISKDLLEASKSQPESTFGVITFNARQQELVEKAIEREFRMEGQSVPESLFVKNIENVQGDERDHIYFSIGYAKAENGKVVSQFGSLGLPGGENRLNVAISRARLSIVIVSSIYPDELPVSESSPIGPRLLKKYLDFAHQISRNELKAGLIAGNQEYGIDFKNFNSKFRNHSNLNLSFSDAAFQENDGMISVYYWDGGRMLLETSMKNYFVFKHSTLRQKGYNVHYRYSRNDWQSSSTLL